MKEAVKTRRARRNEAQWRSLLARHQTSGLSGKAVCRGEGISEASFYRWRHLLKDGGDDGDAVVGKRAPAFVDLGTLSSADARQGRIEIKLDLGDDLVLHLVRG
jgi:transposase-like protein